MKCFMGGCWTAGLVAGAWLGIIPMLVLFLLGGLAAGSCWYQEQLNERRAAQQLKNYPSYKY